MSLIDYHTPEPAVLRKPWRSRPRAYDCISRRYGPNTVLLRAVAVRVFEDVYNAGSGFEDGRMFRYCRDVVGIARLVGPRLAVYGQVEQAHHDDTPLRPVGVGRDFEPLSGPEEDRLAVGARDHTPLQPLERGVHLGEGLDPKCIRVHGDSFHLRAARLRRRSGRHYTDPFYDREDALGCDETS